MHENPGFNMDALAGFAGVAGIGIALAMGEDPMQVAMENCCNLLQILNGVATESAVVVEVRVECSKMKKSAV